MNTGKNRDAKKVNMTITYVMWVFLACIGMAAMLQTASRKTIVIADTTGEQSNLSKETENVWGAGERELLLQQREDAENCIRIPLQKGTKAENIVMENRYMERELWIYLQDANADFYEENEISGNLTPVKDGYCEVNQRSVILKLKMDGVLEYRSTMENDTLVIAYYQPRELYEQIVVVDPMGGGDAYGIVVDGLAEKTVALQVAKQLQKQSEQENIRIYYTRLEDAAVSREDRLALIEAVDADLFIGIKACQDIEHTEYYGICGFYNEEYFIPGFGNVQLADILTRNVTVSASNRAVGLIPAEENSILQDIKIPAAEICVGYLSNEKERALLSQEEYQKKLAEGLANAVLEVYTNKNTNDEVGES